MGPRDWFETIKEVVKKIGSTGDTGGSQTAGTVFGKENAILGMLGAGVIVKSIQRGSSTYRAGTITTSDIVINTVNPEKTIILFDLMPGAGGAIGEGLCLKEINANSFTIYSGSGTNNYSVYYSWQVIEFC